MSDGHLRATYNEIHAVSIHLELGKPLLVILSDSPALPFRLLERLARESLHGSPTSLLPSEGKLASLSFGERSALFNLGFEDSPEMTRSLRLFPEEASSQLAS